jgi:hypothetical protein
MEIPEQAPGILDRDQLITPEELAAFLGGTITTGTLEQWASRGGGPDYHKVGNHRRYAPADVREWLRSRRRSRGAAA